MAEVKRGKDGTITHVRVGNKFYSTKDADRIRHQRLSKKELSAYLKKKGATKPTQLLLDLINGEGSPEEFRAVILQKLGLTKIGRVTIREMA